MEHLIGKIQPTQSCKRAFSKRIKAYIVVNHFTIVSVSYVNERSLDTGEQLLEWRSDIIDGKKKEITYTLWNH